jgi:hypothetical protein
MELRYNHEPKIKRSWSASLDDPSAADEVDPFEVRRQGAPAA